MFDIYDICFRIRKCISAYSYQLCIISSEFLIRFRTLIPYLPNSELPMPKSKFGSRNPYGQVAKPRHKAGPTCPLGLVGPALWRGLARMWRAPLVAGPRHLPVRVPKAEYGVGNREFGIGEIGNGGAKANMKDT